VKDFGNTGAFFHRLIINSYMAFGPFFFYSACHWTSLMPPLKPVSDAPLALSTATRFSKEH